MLIHTIARYFDERDLHLTLAMSYKLEEEIIDRFPSEKMGFYRTSKRGRIYNKLSNLKSTGKSLSKIKYVATSNVQEEETTPEEDAETIRRALRHDKLSAEEFDHCWKASGLHRFKDIKQCTTAKIFDKWPQYKLPHCARLIDIDFNLRFENCTSILITWPLVHEQILNFLLKEGSVNCKSIKTKLCELFIDGITEDSRDATLLWALHGYLVPWQREVSKLKNGKNSVKRFTITDSQESFVLRAQSCEKAEDYLRHQRSKKKPIHPFIIAIGEDITAITDCYCYFDGLKIPSNNFVRAVDVCFKIYHLFNVEYPKASRTFWNFIYNFIQMYFFKIPSKEKFSKVNIIIDELLKTI